MTVTIIGQDEAFAKRVTCRDCGAILQYYKQDIKQKRVSCMGDIDTEWFITCPKCSNDVTVRSY